MLDPLMMMLMMTDNELTAVTLTVANHSSPQGQLNLHGLVCARERKE